MPKQTFFTSESVTLGHPDKLADQISDAILDACLRDDPRSRVAIETLLTRGLAVVAGELTTNTYVEMADVVRQTICRAGYTNVDWGFDGNTTGVLVAIQSQSQDIGRGVDRENPEEQGAGDQGMMFGYACNETQSLMPLPITIAHRLTRKMREVREQKPELGLRPDGKSQVTVEYVDGKPVRIDSILISQQHEDGMDEQIRDIVMKEFIDPVLSHYKQYGRPTDEKIHVNPTGRFVIGGPQGDTGVTGRKIIVDTYGGMARHGGGAFSGKDPSKVDRSAAYMMRYVAKNIVAAGLADRCELQVSYAIGRAEPMSLSVECFGTATVDEAVIEAAVREVFDLRPFAIIKELHLLDGSVKYVDTSVNGHFGNPAFPWERVDRVDDLRAAVGRRA